MAIYIVAHVESVWFPASSGPLLCEPHDLALHIGFAPEEHWRINQSSS